MSRDLTFTDLSRVEPIDDCADFVMDEEKFHGFYDRNARAVWAYLARLTGDRQAADDLLQEAFYRFLRADAKHEDESHRRNSLFRIATNLARDARRRAVARPVGLAGDDIERFSGGNRAGSADRVADVTNAMSHLNPREREMLWLAYAEGASHREIADILGLRPASMKLLLFRARRKMAALLGGKR